MIEVLYNDAYNDLSFIHIVDKETLAIVDSNMYVYDSLCYNPFEPSDEDIADMWRKTTQKYYRIGDEELALKDWRHNQKEQSDNNFIAWLAEDAKGRKEAD